MIGKQISHYNIVSQIGSGGMGRVFRAEDPRLDRAVALKFLPDEYAENEQALERFGREARAASRLQHPHICTVFDIGDWEGRPFIVMELLEGQNVSQRLARGPFGTEELLEVAIQLADALDVAHSEGIIHRDIKPANIIISQRGHATLLDFGLAKLAAIGGSSTGAGDDLTLTGDVALTNPGSTVGTIAYMSPEQVSGEELDVRSDLFSFGAVLYEMATARPAFGGNTSGLIFDAVLNRAPVGIVQLNPNIPVGVVSLIDRVLEKDRGVRYQTAADMRADLKRVRRDSSFHAIPRPTSAPTWPPPVAAETQSGLGYAPPTQQPPTPQPPTPQPPPPSPPPPPAASQGPNMPFQIRLVSYAMIGMGVLSILSGLIGLIGLVASQMVEQISIFQIVASTLSVGGLAVGILLLWIAKGLRRYNNKARIATLVVAFVLLSMFPFGTALGIYIGWVLLSREGRSFFRPQQARP